MIVKVRGIISCGQVLDVVILHLIFLPCPDPSLLGELNVGMSTPLVDIRSLLESQLVSWSSHFPPTPYETICIEWAFAGDCLSWVRPHTPDLTIKMLWLEVKWNCCSAVIRVLVPEGRGRLLLVDTLKTVFAGSPPVSPHNIINNIKFWWKLSHCF